jgi:WD40 repeat protein
LVIEAIHLAFRSPSKRNIAVIAVIVIVAVALIVVVVLSVPTPKPATALLSVPTPKPATTLLVGSCWEGAVLQYDGNTGKFLNRLVKPGAELTCAEGDGIIGPDGNLYVTNFNPGRIDAYNKSQDSVLRYDPATGKLIDVFISPSPALNGPHGLAFGPDGNLYVSTRFSSSVLRYDGKTGEFMGAFIKEGAGGLRDASRMIFKDNFLYVISLESASVLRYDAKSGEFIDVFVKSGSGNLSRPHDFIFGPDGNLYVSSFPNNSVLRYDGKTGEFMGAFIKEGSANINYIGKMQYGPDGRFYLTSCADNKVMRFDARTGGLIDIFVPSGSGGLEGTTFLVFVQAAVDSDSANSLKGDFASIQNNEQGVPAWIVAGNWTMDLSGPLQNSSSSSPSVNATSFDGSMRMVLLNGSAMHEHQLYNFSQTTSAYNATSNSTTFNGTITVTLRDGPHPDVPTSIKIMQNDAISVWLDPASVDNHFGNTPIFGTVWKHAEPTGGGSQNTTTTTTASGNEELYG